MYFYKPDYLQNDFDTLLETLGEVYTLNYDEATPTTFYGLVTQMPVRGNFRDVDEKKELAVSLDLDINKGDYMTDSDSIVYICNSTVYVDVNCKTTQIQICNYNFTFERWQNKKIDSDGVTATPASYVEIANVYGYISRTNQGTFDSKEGQVGISGTQRIFVGLKYNDDTANINIHDEFDYFNQRYEVVDLDYTQMNSDMVSGLIFIYAQIKSGGENESS
jgi:hypothetical protein